jgi:hypothetical protein
MESDRGDAAPYQPPSPASASDADDIFKLHRFPSHVKETVRATIISNDHSDLRKQFKQLRVLEGYTIYEASFPFENVSHHKDKNGEWQSLKIEALDLANYKAQPHVRSNGSGKQRNSLKESDVLASDNHKAKLELLLAYYLPKIGILPESFWPLACRSGKQGNKAGQSKEAAGIELGRSMGFSIIRMVSCASNLA